METRANPDLAPFPEELTRQLRHAIRRLLRAPIFTSAVVATLAIGVGSITAIGTLARSLLRPLPYPDSHRVVAVWETRQGEEQWVAPANYLDWRRELGSFQGRLAAHTVRGASLTVDGVAFRASLAVVSGNFFDVLGVESAIGPGFDPALDTRFPERQVILSHRVWQERFGSDPRILERTILVDEQTYEIVGVAPRALAAPEPGLAAWIRSRSEAPEIRAFEFLPESEVPGLRDAWYFQVVGRLAEGATLDGAQAEIDALSERLAATYPESNEGRGARIRPLLTDTVGDFTPLLTSLGAAVLLLLFTAMVNVGHLMSARQVERSRETAIHAALGAGRGRLLSPVAIEGAILGLGGGVTGAALAMVALERALPGFASVVPRAQEVSPGPATLVAAALFGAALGMAMNLGAFTGAGHRRRPSFGLRSGSQRRSGMARGVISAQTAATVALLAGSAFLGRSILTLGRVDLGFDAERIATVRVAQPDARQHSYPERIATFEDLRARVALLPGIEEVALAATSPLSMGPQAGLRVGGWDEPYEPGSVAWAPVHPAHFETLGMELRQGRLFDDSDVPGGLEVAIVNQSLARSVFPQGDPVGRTVSIGLDGHDRPLTIVGVVSDTRTRGPASPPGPVLYRPIAQTDRFAAESVLLVARTTEATPRDLARIREAVRAERPGMPVYAEALGVELAADFRSTQAMLLRIVGVFSLASLLLGAVGAYGVTADATRRRRQEIGVRMALGASTNRILAHVLGRGLTVVAMGLPFGVAAGIGVGRALRSVLVGVDPLDPLLLASVCVVVVLVSACALLMPARSAALTDPAVTTREQ